MPPLATYIPLALWCNTVAGPPFDPVLLWYAGGRGLSAAWLFIVVGSLCAGAGAALEAGLVRVGRGASAAAPRRFYLMAFLVAASPVPFSLARAAAIAHRPRPWPYALAVAAGRLPRYVALVALWDVLAPPAWVVPAAIVLGLATVAAAALRKWMPRPARDLGAPRQSEL
jgi:uncharacterized membrane protein YdjX (TVP38/TMEM64 family)